MNNTPLKAGDRVVGSGVLKINVVGTVVDVDTYGFIHKVRWDGSKDLNSQVW